MGHGSWVMGHGSWVMGHGSWVMGHGSFDTWMRSCSGPLIVPKYAGLLARPMIDGAMKDSSISCCSNGCRVLDGSRDRAVWCSWAELVRACP